MEPSPKLQKAGRRFLMRLVAENGPKAAAAILRELADELDALARAGADDLLRQSSRVRTVELSLVRQWSWA